MNYVIYYAGRKQTSAPVEGLDWEKYSPEQWANEYAAESGLDREINYDPELLEVIIE